MKASLLVAAAGSLVLAAQNVPPLEVKVIPPDNIYRFAPRVELPGRPSLALVLSGGGARAVAQIGVIQRLEEVGFPVDSITGTSAGALMGALMASGFSGADIEELFTRVDFNRAFLDPLLRTPGSTLAEDEAGNGTILSFRLDAGVPSFALALRDGVEIQRTLEGLMARGAYFSAGGFDGLKYPLRVVATNLETGQGRVFDRGDLVEVLRASMAVPGAFRPVVVEGQPYVDGALVENLPVFTARGAFHPDLTLAVDISSPLERRSVSNFFSLAARSLDLVVERRQWESRAAASFLLRPEMRAADFTDYGNRLPAMVAEGRRVFDDHIPELEAALLKGLGGDEVLPVARVVVNTPRPLPPEALSMLAKVVPQGPIHRRDGIVAIQQLLLHGWAKEARGVVVEEHGEQVLRLELTPFSRVRAVSLQAPGRFKERLEADLRSRFPQGEPYNPEAFGVFLGHWVHRFVEEGTPLVDVRGSGFDDATGSLTVSVREPLLRVITLKEGLNPAEARYIKDLLAPLLGGHLRTAQLREFIALAEHRLHLLELRYQLRPAGPDGDAELVLTGVHHQAQSLDLSLGYDTTLGGGIGFSYRSVNFGGSGVEGEVSGARDRLEDRVFMALRGPVASNLPGAGMELWTASYRQRLDDSIVFPAPAGTPAGVARLEKLDLGLGYYARYGNLGKGKACLDLAWRESALDADTRWIQHQRTVEVSTEWDDFDRHTFPREGLMLRGRYGLGTTVDGPGAPGDFRYGYLRARGLTTFGTPRAGVNPGLDLDLEWGTGRNLPLDRWWGLGGTGFLVGSDPLSYLTPTFLVARLGSPLGVAGPYGTSMQFVPRVDYAVMAGNAGALFASTRGLGMGLITRTILSKFYVEVSYGFLRTFNPIGGWSPATGTFSAVIGTQPFDLWNRH